MNVIAWRHFLAEHRDQFGMHPQVRGALAGIRQRVTAVVNRVSLALRRRVTLEQSTWLLIAVLVMVFLVVLILGATAVGRGGR